LFKRHGGATASARSCPTADEANARAIANAPTHDDPITIEAYAYYGRAPGRLRESSGPTPDGNGQAVSRHRVIQLVAAAIALGLGILLGHVLRTWLGLLAFMAVVAVGYFLTAHTRRDLPSQAPVTDRNKRLASWCSWGIGICVVGLAVSYLSRSAGLAVVGLGWAVIAMGIFITVASYFRCCAAAR